MLPEIIALGPFSIHSYGLAIALGVFFSLYLMTRRANKMGFPPPPKVFDMVFVVVLSGFLGARIFYIIQEWPFYREHPLAMFKIWEGGLVYYGGVVMSLAGLFLYVKRNHLPFFDSCDFMIPFIALTHAFGRIGCFLNGCCYGKVCSLPWAVTFPSQPLAVHPTQLYEALFNVVVFGVLFRLYPRRRFSGEVTALYLIVYSMGRFWLEFFRGDQWAMIFGLTLQQALSLVVLAGGAFLYGIRRRSG